MNADYVDKKKIIICVYLRPNLTCWEAGVVEHIEGKNSHYKDVCIG
jgi:hypothetical protein